jgi:hypothetical protein
MNDSQKYIDDDYKNMVYNSITTKCWIAAGPNPCELCKINANQNYIDLKEKFSSGHLKPLAHDNCHCYLQAGEIDLDSIDIWPK